MQGYLPAVGRAFVYDAPNEHKDNEVCTFAVHDTDTVRWRLVSLTSTTTTASSTHLTTRSSEASFVDRWADRPIIGVFRIAADEII